LIIKADKGNTPIILKNDNYNNRIESFINRNNFTKLLHEITNKRQNIRNCINNNKNITNPNSKWIYINMNPSAPRINQQKSIRPVVNWIDSSGYKLAKHLNTTRNNTLKLLNAFNVRNTSIVSHSLKLIMVNEDTRLCSFHIENT
jgi:hypothetical protein